MKKVLVTGCSGYIGSHLCHMLQGDYEVHGLDIRDPQTELDKFFKIDINKHFNIDGTEYDSVIHLAALVNVSESQYMPIIYYITNLNGTMNVINKIKTKNFILASTGAAELCESAYGISKRAAEDVVREYCTYHNPIDYTIFRFYNVIGSAGFAPTNPDGLMFNLMKSATTGEFTIFGDNYDTPDGTCMRDYVHVNEICNGLKMAIEQPSRQIECLGHGKGYSVKEMVNIFQKVNNLKINTNISSRRKGDAAISVLKHVSPYMKKMYSIEELLRVGS